MAKGKRKKYKFSDEERQMIRDMKQQLSMMGVPRDQWSMIIHQELKFRRQMKKTPGVPKGKVGSLLRKPLEKAQEFLLKKGMKRFNLGDEFSLEGLDDMFGEISEEDKNLMNTLMSSMGMGPVDADKLSKRGTFVSDRSDKRRMIIDIDEDEDEE